MSARIDRMEARRVTILKAMDDLIKGAVDDKGEDRGFTADEQTKWNDLHKQAEHVNGIIVAERKAETDLAGIRADASATAKKKAVDAKEKAETDDDAEDDAPVIARVKEKAVKVTVERDVRGVIKALTDGAKRSSLITTAEKLGVPEMIAIVASGIARNKQLSNISVWDHISAMGYEKLANELYDAKVKALSTGTVGSGAEVMPEIFSQDFIAFLHPLSAILRAGPTRIDLSAGNLRIPAGNAGASASYRVENADIAYTEVTFTEKSMLAKNLSAISAISNELLQRSPMAVAQIVRQEIGTAYALTMDLALLRSTGAGNSPVGIKSQLTGAHVFAAPVATSPTVTNIDQLVATMFYKMRSVNLPEMRLVWIMSERTRLFLATFRNTDGSKVYPTMETDAPVFWGKPVVVSNQVPDNLGVTTDETELYLVDMGHVWLGETGSMTVDVSQEASYVQGGTLISSFSRNQSVIRVVGAHDMLMRYTTAGVCVTGIRWY